jgi:hypothetical protein
MAAGLFRRMTRWGVALALLPVNLGVTWAVAEVVRDGIGSVQFWVPLLAGVALWLLLYNTLPRPMWLYVFGHELTHALCAWCFGAKVSGFRVARSGGEVRLSKSNAFIALAPYFLPIYAVIWSVLVAGVRFTAGPSDWLAPVFHAGLGMSYAFHVTMTAVILRVRQPDLVGEGFLFSWSVIWFANALVLLLALPCLAGTEGVAVAVRLAAWHIGDVVQFCGRLLR